MTLFKDQTLRLILACLFTLSWLGAAGCVTFRPAAEPPAPEVEELLVCRGVSSAGDLLAPRGADEEFGPESESVYAFVRLRDVRRDTSLRWRWFAPDGALARDSGPVAVPTGGRRLDAVTAFDRLDFAPDTKARPAGAWTVVLFMEDAAVEQKTFHYLRPALDSPSPAP